VRRGGFGDPVRGARPSRERGPRGLNSVSHQEKEDEMNSSNGTRLAIVSCVVLAAILAAAPAMAAGNCKALDGSIAAHFEMSGSEGPGWYGRAYLTFGNDPTVLTADLVDLNNGYKDHPNSHGNFAGYEILTYTIGGVGSFRMDAQFLCIAEGKPSFCGFSEEGKIIPEAGTGQFAGMKGNTSIHGSAVFFGTEPTVADPWLWTAKMTGSVCKAK
jgi:hypothetical protein